MLFNFITSKLKIGRTISLLKSCHQVHCTTFLVPTDFGEKHNSGYLLMKNTWEDSVTCTVKSTKRKKRTYFPSKQSGQIEEIVSATSELPLATLHLQEARISWETHLQNLIILEDPALRFSAESLISAMSDWGQELSGLAVEAFISFGRISEG